MKILVHTMDHNVHYKYFREYITKELSGEHEIHHIVHSERAGVIRTTINKLKNRLRIEKKLFRLAARNKDILVYVVNRLLLLLFKKYKDEYDEKKLGRIDQYFTDKINDIAVCVDNVVLINDINDEEELIRSIQPDLMIVVGAPFIRKHIIDLPFRKINLHIGVLPKYRGIKTIEWAIINKDYDNVGYTLHELTEDLDGGGIVYIEKIKVNSLVCDVPALYIELYDRSFRSIVDIIRGSKFDTNLYPGNLDSKVLYSYKFNPLNYRGLLKDKLKLAVYSGNPVQYHAPIFKKLSQESDVELCVMFGESIGKDKFYSKEFNSYIEWDIPLLSGYHSEFFKNYSSKNMKGFFSRINPGMFSFVMKNKFDAVLIHGYDTFSSFLVLVAAKLVGTKVVWRGEASVRPVNRKNRIKTFVKENFLPIYFNVCDAVMYSCGGNKDYLSQFDVPDEKTFFIPCAVDNDFFREHKGRLVGKRDELRDSINISYDDFVIIFVGRMVERKRPEDLISAVSKIHNNNIHLLFVGDGPNKENMMSLMDSCAIKYTITGFVGQNDLPKYYYMSDMFAIVSDYDASPKSLNEALNFSLPALVTDKVGTAKDLVQNDVNGYVVPIRDIESMSEKIDFLNKNRILCREMGEKSLLVSNEWTIDKDVVGLKRAVQYSLQVSRAN